MTLEAWQTYFYLSFCNIGCWTVVQMERVEDSRLARHTQLVSSYNRYDLWSVIVFLATRRWANGCHVGNSTPGANGETWTSNVTPTIPGRTSSTGEWIINFESSISDIYLRDFFSLLRVQNTGQGYAERLVGPEMQWGEQGANGHPRRRRDFPNLFNPNGIYIIEIPFCFVSYSRPHFSFSRFILGVIFETEVRPPPIERTPPSEENVTFLTSMGFSRDRVMRALQTTGNNVDAATNLLLQE